MRRNFTGVCAIFAAGTTTLIDVAFTGTSVTGKMGFAADGLTTNDFWNSYPVALESAPNLKFVDGTASGAGLTVSNAAGVQGDTSLDPMYASYFYSLAGNITLTVTNLSAGVYDFYLYGHGNQDNQNSVFEIMEGSQDFGSQATTNGSGWLSPMWQEGAQYVEFTNVIVTPGQTITITVAPGAGGYAAVAGLQMAGVTPPTNEAPLIAIVPDQVVNTEQVIAVTNYAFSGNGPITFTLASNAPAGAVITPEGIFRWSPACEHGSTTNLITVWVTDSASPPLSNSMTFSVVVNPCVEVTVGSGVVQAGQSTCLPVSLVTTVALTNLGFTLSYPGGFLTNWNITASNSVISSATAQTVDPSNTQFNLGAQGDQMLLGSSVLGSICLGTLPGASAFVPMTIANLGTLASNSSPITNLTGQIGRVVVIGHQPLLELSLGENSTLLLTLYGNAGGTYTLLSATNLAGPEFWSLAGNFSSTDLFQVINLGGATNQMQFFKAVQP